MENYILQFNNEKDFSKYLSSNSNNIIDIVYLLKQINTQNTLSLIRLIQRSFEVLDEKNQALNIENIKKELGISGEYVKFETFSKENHLSVKDLLNNIKECDEKVITKNNIEIDNISKTIFDNVKPFIQIKTYR